MTSSVQLDDGVDLKDLWQVLIDFRKLIGLTAFSFTIIAYIYSLTIIPTYLSEVLVVPVDQESSASNLGGLGGLAALAGLQVEKIDPVRTQMAIFESRKFIEKFIEEERKKLEYLEHTLTDVTFPVMTKIIKSISVKNNVHTWISFGKHNKGKRHRFKLITWDNEIF